MKKVIYLLPVLVLFFASCGVDSELVASGKSHQCNLLRVTKLLEAEPDNENLKTELKRYLDFYDAVIETEVEGKRAQLDVAIKSDLAENGCD